MRYHSLGFGSRELKARRLTLALPNLRQKVGGAIAMEDELCSLCGFGLYCV
jgi:hypothetical protein